MKKPMTVSSSELGSDCWNPSRFIGSECNRVETCKYPEKKKCKAYINKVKIVKTPYKLYAKEAL
jgi:hypothetical protein